VSLHRIAACHCIAVSLSLCHCVSPCPCVTVSLCNCVTVSLCHCAGGGAGGLLRGAHGGGGMVYHFATRASTDDDRPFMESVWTAWTFVADTGLHTEEVRCIYLHLMGYTVTFEGSHSDIVAGEGVQT